MNLGAIFRHDCVNVVPPPDPRCDDPAFALANPSICPARPHLVIKPGTALTCNLGSVQFKAFLVTSGVEVDVSDDSVWSVSNNGVVIIGAGSGNATGVAAGEVIVSASYQSYTATASLTVMGTDGDCCSAQHVGMMLLVDTSRSMSQTFGASYPTRLDYAKAAATRFVSEVNGDKDSVGIISFNEAEHTTVAELSGDVSAVQATISGIAQSQQKTAFYTALVDAIAALDDLAPELRVIVLISDGEDTSEGAANGYASGSNPIQLLQDFKDQGGIVIALGVRAAGTGFARMSLFSTGGFFLNAYPTIEADVLDQLSGLKGYVCAGNCTPAGNVVQSKPQLDYDNFINWDVVDGHVDLIGPGLFDLLPGNGLYVDMAGSTAPLYGVMTSRNTFALTSGNSYRLSVRMAGNQRYDGAPYTVALNVYYMSGGFPVSLLSQTVVINDYVQPFQTYSFTFVAPNDVDAYISIQETTVPATPSNPPPYLPAYGLLLSGVTFDDTTDMVNLLTDDFHAENPVYVPPACGAYSYGSATGYWYACEGEGCLDTPPPAQQPDPNALSNIEQGYVPPTVYSSTRTACATCGAGQTNFDTNLIPAMTGPSAPSGTALASSEITNGSVTAYAYLAFSQTGQPWAPALSPTSGSPQWLRYQFPAAVIVTAYGLAAGSQSFPGALRSWQFQGSNDGSAWTTLDTQTGIQSVGSGSESRFLVTNSTAYLYYRILITEVSQDGGGSNIPYVTTFTMYGVIAQQVCKTATATSTSSQQQADTDAYTAALALATAELNCTQSWTETVSAQSNCPFGEFGQSATRSATYTSLISQADAVYNAGLLAQAAADAARICQQSNNEQKITITDLSFANPYPSVQAITGQTGLITNVQVRLKNFTHTYPKDVRVLLRGPDGTTVLLMQSCGDFYPVSLPINLTLDDSAASSMPQFAVLTTGTFKPTQYGVTAPLPLPAPGTPYGTALSDFIGKDPNGSWSLWVEDTKFLDSGQFANGFDLLITAV